MVRDLDAAFVDGHPCPATHITQLERALAQLGVQLEVIVHAAA
jgi:hypothetical protein